MHQCACGTSFPDVAALSPADETTGDGADSVQVRKYIICHIPFKTSESDKHLRAISLWAIPNQKNFLVLSTWATLILTTNRGGICTQISGSSMTGEDEEEEEAGENSASDDDDEDEDVDEMEDEEDAEETTSCNTPTTVRRASPPIDEVTSKQRRPFYSEWLKGGQNSKSSSDDKERDRESVV